MHSYHHPGMVVLSIVVAMHFVAMLAFYLPVRMPPIRAEAF
jgi:NO-binding membrane sensor protein with MHYT domain